MHLETICRFCGKNGPLCCSHIIPSFVYEWLKNTSGTGHIRDGRQINQRVQDGLKCDLLCHECEQRFGRWESEFAKRVFIPLHENASFPFPYDAWCMKFAVSVSWRVLTFLCQEGNLQSLDGEQDTLIREALLTWQRFLFDQGPNPGQFEQHILPLDLIKTTTDPDVPPNMNRFILRAVEADRLHGKNVLCVYTKMCRVILLGFIEMPHPERWKGTRVHVRKGIIGNKHFSLPHPFFGYLKERARNMDKLQQSVSPRQKERILKAYEKNMERAIGSETVRATIRDVEMFGAKRVFKKESPAGN